jgi:hypothetical protein
MGKKLLIGGGIVLLGIIIMCGGAGWALLRYIDNAGVSAATFEAITVGASEEQTRTSLPDAYELPASEVYAPTDTGRSGMPAGAACHHYISQDERPGPESQVYRVCFAGGKVVEKKTVVIPAEL